jgi:hypothetical protein
VTLGTLGTNDSKSKGTCLVIDIASSPTFLDLGHALQSRASNPRRCLCSQPRVWPENEGFNSRSAP